MSNGSSLKFSDEVIGQLAKLIQMAILSGTDIVDHLRQAQLIVDKESLYLSPDYKDQFEDNIESMLEELEKNASS